MRLEVLGDTAVSESTSEAFRLVSWEGQCLVFQLLRCRDFSDEPSNHVLQQCKIPIWLQQRLVNEGERELSCGFRYAESTISAGSFSVLRKSKENSKQIPSLENLRFLGVEMDMERLWRRSDILDEPSVSTGPQGLLQLRHKKHTA